MKPTDEIRISVQIITIVILNVPVVFVLFAGWNFYAVYYPLCAALGVLSLLAWLFPAVQRAIFVSGVPKERIRMRLTFAIIWSFAAAAVFYFGARN